MNVHNIFGAQRRKKKTLEENEARENAMIGRNGRMEVVEAGGE